MEGLVKYGLWGLTEGGEGRSLCLTWGRVGFGWC